MRSGPPPDPQALRRNREGEWRTLPAAGRPGPEPRWPLQPAMTDRERYVWRDLWKKPQAIVWEENGLEYEVALLVRKLTEAEQPDAGAGLSTLVRQMMDSLMLTTPGLRAARIRIEGADEAAAPPQQFSGGSVRSRLRVVPPA